MKHLELERMQRWFQDVITNPDGVRVADAAAGVRVEDVVLPSQGLTAHERIGVYAGMYFDRLIEVLEEEFSALGYALGEDALGRRLRDYVVAHPSRHFSLNELGARLPAYLRDEAPDLEARVFLAELATLERVVQEVFDAPQRDPLTADALLSIAPADWERARLTPIPALRLLAFTHPINRWYQAWREERPEPLPEPAASWLAVYRREDRIWRMDLTVLQHRILAALVGGLPLGEALQHAVAASTADGTVSEEELQGLQGWFQDWAAQGLFAAVEAGS